ncbi:hypothetical protein [Sphingobium herbicidovorans]|nr:hypothetical protein [Sphingobium herbicidovorans]
MFQQMLLKSTIAAQKCFIGRVGDPQQPPPADVATCGATATNGLELP